MAYGDPDRAGVGGWLAFFVLAMAVITPLGTAITTATSLYGDPAVSHAYPDLWAVIQLYEWSLAAVVIAGCWYTAWRLTKVQVWQTVRIAIIGIWLVGAGSLLADFAGISLITGLPIAALVEGAGGELARPFVFGTLWTAYFLRSKPVANTYPRHGEAEIAAVFG